MIHFRAPEKLVCEGHRADVLQGSLAWEEQGG